LTVLLKTSRLKGVLATRLFTEAGHFLEALPVDVTESQLYVASRSQLKAFQPVSRFQAAGTLSQVFLTAALDEKPRRVPLLEVNVPLHTRKKERLLGVGQFVIEGESLAVQFARLDRNLTLQALGAFGVSGTLLLGSLLWAFRRLRHSHSLLEARTESLLQANQEL